MVIAILAIVVVGIVLYEQSQNSIDLFSGMAGKMNASDIATYARQAGFSGNDLATAVAIALAESSGNPTAVGDLNLTPGGSVGLWQINLKAHPDLAGDLTDPQTNANAAYAIYQAAGNSFHPWTTYKTGAYTAYLATAQQVVNA